MSLIKKKATSSVAKHPPHIFGCLLTSSEGLSFNGLRRANMDFLRAIIRYSRFREIHIFTPVGNLVALQSEWADFIRQYGNDKAVFFFSVNELPEYFSNTHYQVFHQGDPYIGQLSALRDSCAAKTFPVTGRAHTLSTDSHLSRTRDLLLSPIKRCDAILCSSQAQKQVMRRLLAAASSSISDHTGMAIPYKGALNLLPLGIEPDDRFHEGQNRARELLDYDLDCQMILALGRVDPADKMDLHPLLLSFNDLVEGYGQENIKLVIAGAGDASDESVQSLLRQAYALNLEGCIRFELSIDDERKQWLLAACDLFVSISDNIQESFGITPLEAMIHQKAVVLSDWNGYRELVVDGESGYLIPTVSADHDALVRHQGVLLTTHAHLLQAQGTVVDINRLTEVLQTLLKDPELRDTVAEAGYQKAIADYRWEQVIDDYHTLANTLAREAAQLEQSPVRPVGLPYHQVFGHYPAAQVNDATRFHTTDRGVRVLLKSEQGFYYSGLNYLLDQDVIRVMAEECLQNPTLAVLKKQFPDHPELIFCLLWMSKYQLLELNIQTEKPRQSRKTGRLPENKVLAEDVASLVVRPESHRFKLLEPVLVWFLEQSQRYLPENAPAQVRAEIVNHLTARFDEPLLQAIGWVADKSGQTSYSTVLDQIIDSGGLEYLAERFPHWYRLNRRMMLQSLRGCRQLFSRFANDLTIINQSFASQWQQPAGSISGLSFSLKQSFQSVVMLELDNGQTLVYKNRDLRILQHLAGTGSDNIAGQLNSWLGDIPGLATYQILPCFDEAHYGYCQDLTEAETSVLSDPQAKDYYRQMGVLAAVATLMGLADLHQRNIISRSGQLYLLDPKTAFHTGVLRLLEQEVNNPAASFVRGLSETSLEKTGLWHIWQTFHTSRLRYTAVRLDNGELEGVEPQQWFESRQNVIHVGSRNSLDGIQPSLASEYAVPVVEGFRRAIDAVSQHQPEWQQLLQSCTGMEICYQPMLSLNDMDKQLWDLKVFDGFQAFSQSRLQEYFRRMAIRVSMAGEDVQRWLPDHWQESTSGLASPLASNWLKGEQAVFSSLAGSEEVFCLGQKEAIGGQCIRQNTLAKAIELSRILAEDESVRDQFVIGVSRVILQWLEEQLVPGVAMPDSLRKD